MRDGELPDIEPETSVYVYCKGGARAEEAREILEAAGFTQVVNIGGLVDWVAAGGPLAD
jgi:rhodanese-related sulfurtransferase